MHATRRFILLFGVISMGCLSCDLARISAPIPDVAAAPAPDREVAVVIDALRKRHTGLRVEIIEPLAQTIVDESHRAGFSPRFVMAVIHVESSGYNYAMSHVGAMGLMQLLPNTARAIAPRVGVRWEGPPTLFDPVANVKLGVYYLEQLVDRFGDTDVALAAYNWGPTAIASRLRNGRSVPQEYIRKVQNAYLRPSTGWGLKT